MKPGGQALITVLEESAGGNLELKIPRSNKAGPGLKSPSPAKRRVGTAAAGASKASGL